MRTQKSSLLFGEDVGKAPTRPTGSRSVPRSSESPPEKHPSGPSGVGPYAAAVWLCDYDAGLNRLFSTIGWAMPEALGTWHCGAWTLRSVIPPARFASTDILAPVEESRGVVFHQANEREERINDHAERLIADWLVLFMHRALFGQCETNSARTLDRAIPEGVVDTLLVMGPNLPKFAGRVAYCNFSREKTLGILAPDLARGEAPPQNTLPWPSEPRERYCHDCAQRRWMANQGHPVDQLLPRISSFEVIDAIGDAVSGRIPADLKVGATNWQRHAERIEGILDRDSAPARLGVWGHREAQVPRGIRQAAIAATCCHHTEWWEDQAIDLASTLSPSYESEFKKFRDNRTLLRELSTPGRPSLATRVVLARAHHKYAHRLKEAMAENVTHLPPVSPSGLEAENEVKALLGDSPFSADFSE